MTPTDPTSTYRNRLAQHTNLATDLRAAELRTSRARLGCVIAAIATFWVGFDTAVVPASAALAFFPVFAVLVVYHERLVRRRRRAEKTAAFYDRGLARIEDRWIGTGTAGDAYMDATHPYSGDLDLFGRGSLFELLCSARTRAGEHELASWLTTPALPAVAAARQHAVVDLRDRLQLREDLAVIGDDVRAGLDPDALRQWAMSPLVCDIGWARLAAPILVASTLAGAAAWAAGVAGPGPFALAVLAEMGFAASLRRRVHRVLVDVQRPTRDLSLLVQVLARIEPEPAAAPRLRELKRGLEVDGEPPSRQIAKLQRRVELLDARKNELFAPLAAMLLWGTQCALAIEAWRRHSAAAIPSWVDAVGEFEALLSLAGFAYENSSLPFPEFTATPSFTATSVAHPLLPRSTRVANDVRLDPTQRVLLISGSNMSGKSTFLRTVGVNVILAQAGAPICADRLALSPLALGASLRIVDSLQSGTSHFYAELKRLRQIVDLTDGPEPVLFLLDEILHGTNSHDRRIGAEAVVRELVRRGALGLVTTHDLALAEIADDPDLGAVNVHFEDHIEDGEMRFDYQMRPGIVRKSNALELMRSVGLDVQGNDVGN